MEAIILKLDKEDAWYNCRELFEGKKMTMYDGLFWSFINKEDIKRAYESGYVNKFLFYKPVLNVN